ncbi:hypothetical protein [Pseudogemmobacter humi]|uniref:Uncharacterized protein n=1 Tax=Pseudogemmobacter humi TaxID=2483812 RepID=A0A3P5XIL4_9RHOB|nr:hypothetical protein [Pseudogemmobacter humi]VDC31420.1 hypothetical protein XINFAN_02883 [Pseudogemmobacter humi]
MTHYRTAYRNAVKDAIAGDAAFGDFTFLPAWSQKIDPSQLPVFGVATPSEGSSRQGGDTVHRVTTVRVAMKVVEAGDIEAELDDLSFDIEALVLPVLEPLSHIVELNSTATSTEAGGERKTGTLVMDFSVTRFTDAGNAT